MTQVSTYISSGHTRSGSQLWAGVAMLALLLVGCGGQGSQSSSSTSRSQETTTSSDNAREGSNWSNPFQAMGELSRLGQQLEQASEDLENLTPVDPVHFSDLVDWLPNAPGGWTREDPEGSTTSMGEFRISQAETTYRRGDSRIDLSLIDSAYNPALYAPFLLAASFSQESTSSYDKGVTFGSHPGRESFTYTTQSGSLAVLVERRFILEIKGSGIEANELRQWWDRLNIGQLERMARS